MLKVLSELLSEKRPASLYTDCDTSRFHFGYVLALNEKEIAIHMISPDGEDDGIITLDVDCVFRVEENGQYFNKMERLCFGNNIKAYDLNVINGDIKRSAIKFAQENKLISSIELLNSGLNDIVGFINMIDDKECKIKQVDEYGYADGFSYVSIENITKITVLSQDEKRVQKLWELNQ